MKSRVFVVLSVLALSFSAHAEVKWGGHLVAKYKSSSKKAPQNGFRISDAAIKMTFEGNPVSAHIDLPFNSESQTLGNFSFATTKAQAYVTFQSENGMSKTVGQFDTIFGSEGNDSPDIAFTSHAFVTSLLLPWVHTGFLITSPIGDGKLSLLGANNGANGTGSTLGVNGPEVGLKWEGKFGTVTPFVGAVYRFMAAGTTNYFINAGTGLELGPVTSELQLVQARLSDVDGGSFGVMAAFHLPVMEKVELGLRGEYLDNVVETASVNSGAGVFGDLNSCIRVAIGPKVKVGENGSMKLNYTLTNRTGPSIAGVQDKTTDHAFEISSGFKI